MRLTVNKAASKEKPTGEIGFLRRVGHSIVNAITTRSEWISRLLEKRDNINAECGYPDEVTREDYRYFFDREGLARRIVTVLPDECWALDPEVFENEEEILTEFEEAWSKLNEDVMLYHYLHRIDILSGIGHFGLLYFGFDDGKDPAEPLAEALQDTPSPYGTRKVTHIRVFDETQVDVDTFENDRQNPRYGLPITYNVRMMDSTNDMPGGVGRDYGTIKVHWTRVLHVADNRTSSEVYGTPRQQPVYNRIVDVRKVMGGSAQMFWQGAFPGLALEVDNSQGDVVIDHDSIREEVENYLNSLQRYVAMGGVKVKSLAPQVASPADHIRNQLEYICISLGTPLRVLLGSEEAKLASTQDARTWNKRLRHRQTKYLTPHILRPTAQRLIHIGALPAPKQPLIIDWPDLNTPTDDDRANVAMKRADAMAKYIANGGDSLIDPVYFLVHVMGFSLKLSQMMIKRSQSRIDGGDTFADDEIERTPEPPAPVVAPPKKPAPKK